MQLPVCKNALKYICGRAVSETLLTELMIHCFLRLPLLQLVFAAVTRGKVSLWLWKSPENAGNFFYSTL